MYNIFLKMDQNKKWFLMAGAMNLIFCSYILIDIYIKKKNEKKSRKLSFKEEIKEDEKAYRKYSFYDSS